MSFIVGPLITTALNRVRDIQGSMTSRTTVLDLFRHSQNIVNAALSLIVETAVLTTNKNRLIYDYSVDLPLALKVIGVRYLEKDLELIKINDLLILSPKWHRKVAQNMQMFVPLGRNMLVLYPGLPFDATIKVTYSKRLLLPGEEDTLTVADQVVPLIENVVYAFLLLKGRKANEATRVMKQVSDNLRQFNV